MIFRYQKLALIGFCTVLLLSAAVGSAVAESIPYDLNQSRSTTVTDLKLPSGNSAVALVKSLSVDSVVQLKSSAGILLTQDLPQERGVGAIFFLESREYDQSYEISVRRKYNSDLVITADVHIQFLEQGSALESGLYLLGQAANTWHQRDKSKRLESIGLLRAAKSLLPSLELQQQYGLIDFYLNSLLSLELYMELEAYFDQMRNKSSLFFHELGAIPKYSVAWSMASALSQMERLDKAIPLYRELLSDLDVDENIEGYWLLNREEIRADLGNKLILAGHVFNDSELLEEGKSFLNKAISITKKLGDPRLLGQMQNGIAPYYSFIGDDKRAIHKLLESIEHHKQAGSGESLSDSYNNIAVLYRRHSQLDKALQALTHAIRIDNEFALHSKRANLTLNLASVYVDVGKPKLAATSADYAHSEFVKAGNEYAAAQAGMVLGKAQRMMGQTELAINTHKQGLETFLDLLNIEGDDSELVFDIGQAFLELSRDYLVAGKLDIAKLYALKNLPTKSGALAIKSTDYSPQNLTEIESLLVISKVALETGLTEEYEVLKRVLTRYFEQNDEPSRYPLQHLEFLGLTLEDVRYSENDKVLREIVEKIVFLNEDIRKKLDSKFLGPAWSARATKSIEFYIATEAERALLSSDRPSLAELFKFIERTHAVSLRDSRAKLSNEEAAINHRGREELLNLTGVEERTAAFATSETERNLALVRVTEAREAFLANIAREKINGLKFDQDDVLSIQEIMNLLNPNEMVARYFLHDRFSFVFLISSERWQVVQVPTKSEMSKLKTEVMEMVLAQSNLIASTKLNTNNFLGIPAKFVKESTKLIFVASSPLVSTPIGMINSSLLPDNYQPLEKFVEIVQTYSLTDYFSAADSASNAQASNDIAIFSDPSFDGNSNSMTIDDHGDSGYRNWSTTLSRLPWTASEARSIEAIFSKKRVVSYSGKDATSEKLMSSEMRDSKILHIASHGYFSESTPDVVGIATAGQGDGLPGFLTLTQLLSRRFYSNLVIISGCETFL